MKVSGDFDEQVVETLHAQIHEIIRATDAANADIIQNEIIQALLITLGEVLLNISCPDCRRLNKKLIERMLPTVLRDAMKQAAQNPQSSEHVH